MSVPGDIAPPEITLTADALDAVEGAAMLAVPFSKDDDSLVLGPGGAELIELLGADLLALLEREKATGRAGEVIEHPVLEPPAGSALERLLLVGVGDSDPADFRRAAAAVVRRARGRDRAATSIASLTDGAGLRAFVEGLMLGAFAYHHKTGDPQAPVGEVVLTGMADPESRRGELRKAEAAGRAAWAARTLATVPSNIKNPAWLATQAESLGAETGLQVQVWDETTLARQGFGGLLAVGAASATPPRLVRLDYAPDSTGRRGRGRFTPHVVLVGKGITFDTGGLSLKPAEAMTAMKRDMTGAGVVLAVMTALRELECPVRVTGLLALAENAVGGSALRPGDIIRHYGGRTTEVTNTDAEGRLVLADALAYAAAELEPTLLVDVATLTGAVKVSLGQRTGGIFATDDALADALIAAGRAAGEPVWRLPLVDDYEQHLESKVADADNAGGGPGAITAALFLRHFTGGLPWAHLDIASVGDSPVDAFEWTSGPTGFGVRLLLQWLERGDLDGIGTT